MTSLPLAAISNYNPNTASPLVPEGLGNLMLKWRRDPESFIHDTFASSPSGGPVFIDPQQARILQAVADHDRVAARTGRGVGKTTDAALLVHWWLATRFPALVVTSAGTWNHLEDKLWPEIRLWSREWLLRDSFDYQQMGIYHKDRPEALRAVSTSSDKAANVEGFHSPHLLLLVDEAKGMPDEIFTALLASLTSEGVDGISIEQKVVALSTPPLSRQGWFARVSSSSEWHVIHISGIDSPRVSRSYIQEILDTYGPTSPEYQSYVLGDIPEASSETVVPLVWFEACQQLAPCHPKNSTRKPVLTCDVAREGEDLSTFGVFDRASFNLVSFPDGAPGWLAHADLMKVVGRCQEAVKLYPGAAAICIDDTGLGGGVTDRLRELQFEGKFPASCSVIAIKFGSKASREDRYNRKKDELWWAAREVIRQQRISIPTDDEIRAWRTPRGSDFKVQMTSALYDYDSTDRIDVLDKRVSGRERTKSLPTKSPDLAHAFILGVRYYLRQNEMPELQEPPKDQGEALHRRVQDAVKVAIQSQPGNLTDPYRRRR